MCVLSSVASNCLRFYTDLRSSNKKDEDLIGHMFNLECDSHVDSCLKIIRTCGRNHDTNSFISMPVMKENKNIFVYTAIDETITN